MSSFLFHSFLSSTQLKIKFPVCDATSSKKWRAITHSRYLEVQSLMKWKRKSYRPVALIMRIGFHVFTITSSRGEKSTSEMNCDRLDLHPTWCNHRQNGISVWSQTHRHSVWELSCHRDERIVVDVQHHC